MFNYVCTYTDFNGVERTETHRFNFSKNEIIQMEMGFNESLTDRLKRIIDSKDNVAIMNSFRKLVLDSYGIKSDDGRRFEKSPEISKAFSETGAFDELYMKLGSDAKFASDFVNGIIPHVEDTNSAMTKAVPMPTI